MQDNGIKKEPNISDMHTAQVHRIVRYLRYLLGPLRDEIFGEHNSRIKLAMKLECELGWVYEQDMECISELKKLLDNAERQNTYEDQDAVTGSDLVRIMEDARKSAEKIFNDHEFEPETVEDKVYMNGRPDNLDYYTIYLCDSLISLIEKSLQNHYMHIPKIRQKSILRQTLSKFFHKGIKYLPSPTGIIAIVSLILMLLIIKTSWYFYSDKSFQLNLLSEAHGLLAELLLVGVIFAILERKYRSTEKHDEEI